jgi:hypothetical protein
MRVVIPLVAVPVGRVDREVDGHPVPIDKTRGKFLHDCDSEPHRVSRRQFCLGQAAMAGPAIWA